MSQWWLCECAEVLQHASINFVERKRMLFAQLTAHTTSPSQSSGSLILGTGYEGEAMAMDWTGWYCIGILVVGVAVMSRDIVGPDFAMMGMLVAMMIPGERVLDIKDALSGFSNPGLLTVASASRPLVPRDSPREESTCSCSCFCEARICCIDMSRFCGFKSLQAGSVHMTSDSRQ